MSKLGYYRETLNANLAYAETDTGHRFPVRWIESVLDLPQFKARDTLGLRREPRQILQAGAVAVSLAGNGDVRIKGKAGSLGVVIDGSGDVYCADLLAERVAVRIRGSGDARVHATDELKVDIDGSGDVRYRGTPTISKSVRGAGAVRPLS